MGKEEDERVQRRFSAKKRALAKLWQAYASYQEWEDDEGDPDTFAAFALKELPGLIPVSGG